MFIKCLKKNEHTYEHLCYDILYMYAFLSLLELHTYVCNFVRSCYGSRNDFTSKKRNSTVKGWRNSL